MNRYEEDRMRRGWLVAAFFYALLIGYGSLFPLSGWTEPAHPWHSLVLATGGRRLSSPDLIVNVLAYVPLGLSVVLAHSTRRSAGRVLLRATLIGFALSLVVESLQVYLPSRVSALSDLLTNILGTFVGAMLGLQLGAQRPVGMALARWRMRWIQPGRAANVGLATLGLWALSQLNPLVPSFDIGKLRQGLAPIARVLTGATPFVPTQALQYLCMIAALALLLHHIVRPQQPRWLLVLVAFGAVLGLKVPMIGRQLSLEMLSGLLLGVALAVPLSMLPRRALGAAGMALVGASVVIEALAPGSHPTRTAFNWVPFRAHLTNPLIGVNAILQTAWSAFAWAVFARMAGLLRKTPLFAACSALLVGGAVFALELAQQLIPGRTGDLTTALIAAAAWLVSWHLLPAPGDAARERPPAPGSSR